MGDFANIEFTKSERYLDYKGLRSEPFQTTRSGREMQD
jgi:hypothetical protein